MTSHHADLADTGAETGSDHADLNEDVSSVQKLFDKCPTFHIVAADHIDNDSAIFFPLLLTVSLPSALI